MRNTGITDEPNIAPKVTIILIALYSKEAAMQLLEPFPLT